MGFEWLTEVTHDVSKAFLLFKTKIRKQKAPESSLGFYNEEKHLENPNIARRKEAMFAERDASMNRRNAVNENEKENKYRSDDDFDKRSLSVGDPARLFYSSSKRCSTSFTRPINKSSVSTFEEDKDKAMNRLRVPPSGENTIILYFTSLRAIRKTYEDCCNVRLILQGFRVPVDERDISLHAEYKRELQRLIGTRNVQVPMLFVKGKLIGGANTVIELHEEGKLRNYFVGFQRLQSVGVCEGCGDLRFVVCDNCDGSLHVFDEGGGLIRCSECNENGLVRCQLCY